MLKMGVVMTKAQLEKKIARLEFVYDQLEAELLYVDQLLQAVGFPHGLASAKEVALDLLAKTQTVAEPRVKKMKKDTKKKS